MTCPECKLVNPPSAMVCDCGHLFDGGARNNPEYRVGQQSDLLRQVVAHLAAIRTMLRWLVWALILVPAAIYLLTRLWK